jgi:hypothetical protein
VVKIFTNDGAFLRQSSLIYEMALGVFPYFLFFHISIVFLSLTMWWMMGMGEGREKGIFSGLLFTLGQPWELPL